MVFGLVNGQVASQTRIDTLKVALTNELEYDSLVTVYYDIADIYYYTDLDSSLKYASKDLELVQNANNKFFYPSQSFNTI